MQKLQNSTLQKFLDKFINELKRENSDRGYHETRKLDIPFIISTLYQSFDNNTDKYKEFISDLRNWSDYGIIIENPVNEYNGIVDATITLIKYSDEESDYYQDYNTPGYDYKLCFSYDERNWGYCECTPDMPDYREDKHCCGHGCDASFCTFELHKIIHVIGGTWHGDEHDYWEFEDEFYMSDKELADKKEEEDRLRKIEELKNQIETASKKLKELVGDKV